MGTEPVEGLPEDLEAWVAERAAATDRSRAEVVRRLLAAHRLLDENAEGVENADLSGLVDGQPAAPRAADGMEDLEARVEELAGRVGELEGDLDEKITDVRERVIQVKREADAKAPAEHDHPAIDRRIDEGFGNYEEILEYLTERAETLEADAADRDEKLRRVANAVVGLRRRVAALEGVIEEREGVAELREAANRRGIAEAACESCGNGVRIGLLGEPACPHCGSPFEDVEAGGWFKSNLLTVGNRPALESGPTPSDGNSERTEPSGSRANGSGPEPSTGPVGSEAAATDTGERDAAGGPAAGGNDEHRDTADGSDAWPRDSDPDAGGSAGDPADGDGPGDSEWSETMEDLLGTDETDAGTDGGDDDR
ncbi:hypothetical protein [Halobellus ruber]|uniref:CopG family transcriptional regulator n=1 Tax=Halobellus ruber TaxID=2761102 RepID=A0A7J9SE45_9EURY|nr:hypothetical protein [Halobellus ruber]MBB6645214.1 hypothetical protein [Halobellus ruber]